MSAKRLYKTTNISVCLSIFTNPGGYNIGYGQLATSQRTGNIWTSKTYSFQQVRGDNWTTLASLSLSNCQSGSRLPVLMVASIIEGATKVSITMCFKHQILKYFSFEYLCQALKIIWICACPLNRPNRYQDIVPETG